MYILKNWLVEKNVLSHLLNCSAESLNKVLRSFYPFILHNTNSEAYSVASYIAIRSGISHYSLTFNIMNCGTFNSSNDVFISVIKDLRKKGKDTSQHQPPTYAH